MRVRACVRACVRECLAFKSHRNCFNVIYWLMSVKHNFCSHLRQKYLWDPSNFDPHAYGISLQRQHLVPYKGRTHKVSVHDANLTKDISNGYSKFVAFIL